LTLENLSPQTARDLQVPSGQSGAVITEVDPDGPASGVLGRGDIILSVNRKQVGSAGEAARELQKVQAGHLAQLIVWRRTGETFVTVKKD
jgi:serine protease Do